MKWKEQKRSRNLDPSDYSGWQMNKFDKRSPGNRNCILLMLLVALQCTGPQTTSRLDGPARDVLPSANQAFLYGTFYREKESHSDSEMILNLFRKSDDQQNPLAPSSDGLGPFSILVKPYEDAAKKKVYYDHIGLIYDQPEREIVSPFLFEMSTGLHRFGTVSSSGRIVCLDGDTEVKNGEILYIGRFQLHYGTGISLTDQSNSDVPALLKRFPGLDGKRIRLFVPRMYNAEHRFLTGKYECEED